MRTSRPFAKTLIPALASCALIVGASPPATAGTATGSTAGWTINVVAPDITWTQTESCELFPIQIVVSGWGAERWVVDMSVRHSLAGAESGSIFEYRTVYGGNVNGTWTGDFQLCPGDSPPGTYVVQGTVEYGYSFDYDTYHRPGALSAPLSTTFTLSKLTSQTQLNPIASNGTEAQVSGRVTANSATLGSVGVGTGRVSIQQSLNGGWLEIDYTYPDSLGNFTETVRGISTVNPVRAVFGETSKISGSASNVVTPQMPPPPDSDGDGVVDAQDTCPTAYGVAAYAGCPPPPTAIVTVKAKGGKSKLYVDVNPNKGRGYWTFQVQSKRVDNSWGLLKTYKTQGTKETRTINPKRGTYRVVVNAKYGYRGAVSAEVYLKK